MKKLLGLAIALTALSAFGCARDAKPSCGLPCIEAAHSGKLLHRAWGANDRDVWAVGLAGTIAHYDGSTWSTVDSGTKSTLFGVWGSSEKDVWAVGAKDTVLHFDGAHWTASQTGLCLELHAVFGTGPSDVWAVGSGGAIVHFDGASWTSTKSPTSEGLYAISGSSAKNLWAVGTGGAALHFDGVTWTAKADAGAHNFYDVWVSESGVWAVGFGGVFRLRNWQWKQEAAPSGDFVSIVGSSDDDLWIAGFGDEVIHWDGARYDAHASGIGGFQALTSKWAFASDGRIVAWGRP
ncbi:MAG: WD40/YVTN/BNR-like repeat-containing protein [Polyangiales bacterium]